MKSYIYKISITATLQDAFNHPTNVYGQAGIAHVGEVKIGI